MWNFSVENRHYIYKLLWILFLYQLKSSCPQAWIKVPCVNNCQGFGDRAAKHVVGLDTYCGAQQLSEPNNLFIGSTEPVSNSVALCRKPTHMEQVGETLPLSLRAFEVFILTLPAMRMNSSLKSFRHQTSLIKELADSFLHLPTAKNTFICFACIFEFLFWAPCTLYITKTLHGSSYTEVWGLPDLPFLFFYLSLKLSTHCTVLNFIAY